MSLIILHRVNIDKAAVTTYYSVVIDGRDCFDSHFDLFLQNVNIVAEVAEFLQTYTNGICAENYDQIKEVLQALIEMCVGNPPNQHVILEKQVVDQSTGYCNWAEQGR